jgi:hypothetical protein
MSHLIPIFSLFILPFSPRLGLILKPGLNIAWISPHAPLYSTPSAKNTSKAVIFENDPGRSKYLPRLDFFFPTSYIYVDFYLSALKFGKLSGKPWWQSDKNLLSDVWPINVPHLWHFEVTTNTWTTSFFRDKTTPKTGSLLPGAAQDVDVTTLLNGSLQVDCLAKTEGLSMEKPLGQNVKVSLWIGLNSGWTKCQGTI